MSSSDIGVAGSAGRVPARCGRDDVAPARGAAFPQPIPPAKPPHGFPPHRQHPQLLHRRAYRPRQVDAGRPADPADRHGGVARHERADARFDGHRARARHHHQGADRPARIPGATTARPTSLNLMDTPGHVDFGYEVSRSLAACEGSLLVVDASQGVEAQTLSQRLRRRSRPATRSCPILNKIDLPAAEPDRVKQQIEDVIGIDASRRRADLGQDRDRHRPRAGGHRHPLAAAEGRRRRRR